MNEEKQRVLECPHCHNKLKVVTRVEIVDLVLASELDPHFGLSDREKAVLEDAKSIGIISIFSSVTAYAKGPDAPRQIDGFFLTFLRTTNARRVPRFALDYFLEALGPGRFQFWQGQGIGAVVIDDLIRAFIPLDIVIGTMAKSSTTPIRQLVGEATLEGIKEWFSRHEDCVLRNEQLVSFSSLRKAALNGLRM